MQRHSHVWPMLGSVLLLLGGLILLPTVDGLTRCTDALSAQKGKAESGKPAQDRVIVQPADSIPGPDRLPDDVFVPSPRKVVDAMLELANVQPGEVVFDLGSGDGRICIAAAKTHGARAYGYELQADLVKESLQNVKKNKVEHLVTIERRDILKLDLSGADVVTFYLLPELNIKLIPQLEKMKPGARIVSHVCNGWFTSASDIAAIIKPDKVLQVEVDRVHEIYLWKTPLKKDEKLYQEYLRKWSGLAK